VAYQTNESGEFQIVVQPDLLHRARRQADGSFHRRPGLNIRGGHASGAFSGITREQRSRIQQAGVRVSRDGRFLINQPAEAAMPPPPITLILNWHPKP